jgi:hypothetical protein
MAIVPRQTNNNDDNDNDNDTNNNNNRSAGTSFAGHCPSLCCHAPCRFCCTIGAAVAAIAVTGSGAAAAVALNMPCHARPASGGGGPITITSAPDATATDEVLLHLLIERVYCIIKQMLHERLAQGPSALIFNKFGL